MKSPILLTLGALIVLAIGLLLVLPRKNNQAGPLAQQVEIQGTVAGVGVEQADTIVDDAMMTTLKQFLDKILMLQPDVETQTLTDTYAYLAPSLQEALAVKGLDRDDFIVLFDQETKAFPPSEYEVLTSEVINENLQEANVRLNYPGEPAVIYNIELERIGNEWKVIAVN